MSTVGLQYGLYHQSRSLAVLVDQVLLERRRGETGTPEQEQLGHSLQKILSNGLPELAWRVVALRLRHRPEFKQYLDSGIPDALIQGRELPELIPFLERLSEVLEYEQVQSVARIRG